MRVALIHDWLTGMRGGEKVLEAIGDLYPEAPIYTLIHVPGSVSAKIESHPIRRSFLQHAPLVGKYYRHYLPLFPTAIERFDLSPFDLIISSSHCVAKGIIPPAGAVHICYCHTPMRYMWSHYEDYFGDHKIGFLRRMTLPVVREYLCSWDTSSNHRVDRFAANSRAVAARIQKYYRRDAKVVYPPVDIDFYTPDDSTRENFFLIVSALVPYKRIEIAVEAFNRLGRPLVIVGTGPEQKPLKKMASPHIRFLGKISPEDLRGLYRTASALVQPAEEDFGINLVEALACECPVVAYGAGGALESVVDHETGLFFNQLSAEAILETVDMMSSLRFNKPLMREIALRFSPERFNHDFQSFVQDALQLKKTK